MGDSGIFVVGIGLSIVGVDPLCEIVSLLPEKAKRCLPGQHPRNINHILETDATGKTKWQFQCYKDTLPYSTERESVIILLTAMEHPTK